MIAMNLKVIDNDTGEISVSRDDTELRGWSYASPQERRTKMLAAREYVEGWFDALKFCAKLADTQADEDDRGSAPYDSGAGSCGYRLACRDLEEIFKSQLSG